ncbi:MAG: hypothetical protein HY565_02665 [Candidatus Kerfeldbacteria bacterium]|nr:hypothetical protein [Candidatus Kerfeldbacteria bacterium]
MNGKKVGWGCLVACLLVGIFLAVISGIIYFMLASRLPAERPAKFSFEINEGGGMNDESMSYSIQNGHVTYEDEYESSELTAEFDFTDAELDYLWQLLRVERFDRIREHDGGDVYDRGGTSQHLSFGDESIDLSDSGSSFIDGDSAKRFYAIEDAVIALAKPYIDEQKQAITVRISDELLSKVDYVQLNDQIIYETGEDEELPAHISVLPGDYVLAIATILPPPINYDYQRLTLTVTANATVLIGGTVDAITVTEE